ncbi:hypothetical protein PFISCL1PPCAC_9291, partial [Pristionchus fissidentatus]
PNIILKQSFSTVQNLIYCIFQVVELISANEAVSAEIVANGDQNIEENVEEEKEANEPAAIPAKRGRGRPKGSLSAKKPRLTLPNQEKKERWSARLSSKF